MNRKAKRVARCRVFIAIPSLYSKTEALPDTGLQDSLRGLPEDHIANTGLPDVYRRL